MRKRLTILGSTGSIGTQALDVVRCHHELYEVYALTAGSQAELLVAQAREFHPACVVIADESRYAYVRRELEGDPVRVLAGHEALVEVAASSEADIVLVALVGFAGLEPTLAAIEAGKTIALANKETLVVAGELVTRAAKTAGVSLLPVDSEHSAIFQSLMGECVEDVEEIILTASGGPFRDYDSRKLLTVTAAEALRHPCWEMGAKVTIDSATMMNKGFEVIEARWLFGVDAQRIRVVVHPQSIVHSAVLFRDGAVKAQLGVPDMRIPIQLALSYPRRLRGDYGRLDWYDMRDLTFSPPDTSRFPCLALAYEALRQGGTAPCAMNAANEVANLSFRQGTIPFPRIPDIIEKTMSRLPLLPQPTLSDYLSVDHEARTLAAELIQ